MTASKSEGPRFDLPTIEDESRPFWNAAKAEKLMIGRCHECGKLHYYPRPFCPHCWSTDVDLVEASGRGTLYTYSIIYMNDLPPFNERVPYVVAMVDLEEGLRISTNIVDCPHDEITVGMPVIVTFHTITDDISVPLFRPG